MRFASGGARGGSARPATRYRGRVLRISAAPHRFERRAIERVDEHRGPCRARANNSFTAVIPARLERPRFRAVDDHETRVDRVTGGRDHGGGMPTARQRRWRRATRLRMESDIAEQGTATLIEG